MSLEGGHVGPGQQRGGGSDRVLPDQILGRDFRPQIPHLGAHVAVGQFEPCAGEGIGKGGGVVQERLRNRAINRVQFHRHIRCGHHRRVLDRGVMGIDDHILVGAVDRVPLLRASRAAAQLPVVFQQDREIAHIPGGRVGLPRALDPRAGGMDTRAGAKGVAPAKALLLNPCGFGFAPDKGGIAGAVGLAEGVATCGQGDGFLVIHCHAGKGFADVAARSDRIGHTVRTLGVHIDQAHLHGGQRGFQLAVTLIAGVGQPCLLGTPIDVFLGLPHVGTATAEAKGFEAHRFHRAIAGKDHQVGPRQRVAIFLLDRPQQAAGLVKVDVVRPRVQRRKALGARGRAATAIAGAVGASRVPRHAHKQRAIMAPIGRPPRLIVGHQGVKVGLDGGQVEGFERLGIVEIGTERV